MELLLDAHFWVGVAFVIFVGILLWAGVPKLAAKAIDSRADKLRARLAEAEALRAEAQAAADVKAAAAELAAQIAEDVLKSRLAGAKADPLIDQAIGQLPGKLQ